MAVRIELLDYVSGNGVNTADFTGATFATGWTAESSSIRQANWSGDGTNNTKYAVLNNTNLIAGRTYRITLSILEHDGQGNIGISSENAAGSAMGTGFNLRNNAPAVITETITCTASGALRVFGRGTNSGRVQLRVIDTEGIDREESVFGELDITDNVEFPLSLTFQVNDVKNITATTGDFSKTFKIPATKNNNKILKHIYTPNNEVRRFVNALMPCRISVNNFFSLSGLLKITGVGGYGHTPSYYNCVFFGNNLSWAKLLDGKTMDQIDWGTDNENIVYQKDEISATWSDTDCNSSNRAYVYPIVSYGDYNAGGTARTIQLLDTAYDYNQTGSTSKIGYYGFFDDGSSYETPLPQSDWRPAIYVKTTLEKIFSQVGYTLSSNFFDTDMFKKLVWLLPNFTYNNPDDRYEEFSVEADWTNNQTISADSVPDEQGLFRTYEGAIDVNNTSQDPVNGDVYFLTGAGRQLVGLNTNNFEVTLDNGSYVDLTEDEITIGEYGYYTIEIKNVMSKVAEAYKGSNDLETIEGIKSIINVEVQTAGQSGFNIIGSVEFEHQPTQTGFSGGSNQTNNANRLSSQYKHYPNLTLGDSSNPLWLNKNDKIRLTKGLQITGSSDPNQNFIVYVFNKAASDATFAIKLDPDAVAYGQTYDLTNVMNKEYKQIDFVKGIVHAFNLNLSTNEIRKTVTLEPFDDFYRTYGSAIDWTSKLDRSRETIDNWADTDLKRSVIFKYMTDSKDEKVKERGENYFRGIEDEYPYTEELSLDFERGESIFENPFFAGTYNAQDSDTTKDFGQDPPFNACLWEVASSAGSARDDVPKGFDFKPRLLSWNKLSPTTIHQNKFAYIQTWANVTELIIAKDNMSSAFSTIYPQATSINRHNSSMPNLAYGNVWVKNYDAATGNYTNSTTVKGLYDTYYKRMFEMLKLNPRVRTVYIDLKLKDIVNLDFRKLIYIDGLYWRLNKIIDYKPNQNSVTKVELIQWIETGSFAASAPAYGSSGGSSGWGSGVYGLTSTVTEVAQDSNTAAG